MTPFSYQRADSPEGAIRLAQQPGAKFIGGGTNLLDLIKGGVERPQMLIDVSRLKLAQIDQLPDGSVRIGAMVRNSDAANHPVIRRFYPLLSQAFLAGASPQLRNMATVGGNLLQRTRCHYFYDTAYDACNKREPGTGCAALEGINRQHAILGASNQCIATNPSDMNVALAALNASVRVQSAAGERVIPIAEFHRLPGNEPDRDTTLRAGELIVAVDLPKSTLADHAYYLKVRDRASYAFALVSVAAALDIRNGIVHDAGIALGGVAHKPWRQREAEKALINKRLDMQSMHAAADILVRGAQPYEHNRFKVELARRSVVRALSTAGGVA
ncbi:MAG TPA: xanthine dehydrogenase family protein subunit M [Rhodocyclaceae bacterium]|nr:xanthine dehydrogenase family protein subunit M [Rhodocyclaceae bacterium]